MTTIGQMRNEVSLKVYEGVDDGYGNVVGDWVEKEAAWARIQPLKGSETIIAARLSGVQPVVITVRVTPAIAAMTSAWRVKDTRNDLIYQIKSVANTDERGEFLEILAELET